MDLNLNVEVIRTHEQHRPLLDIGVRRFLAWSTTMARVVISFSVFAVLSFCAVSSLVSYDTRRVNRDPVGVGGI